MIAPCSTLGLFGPIGWPELLILAFLGLLIFGKRLPSVGKGMGQFINNFRSGLKGTGEEIDVSVREPGSLSNQSKA